MRTVPAKSNPRNHRKITDDFSLTGNRQRIPKGAALRDRLEQFLRGVQKEYGYQQVITPHIGNKELYVTSGHYAKYGKDSFQPIHTPIEGEEYLLKPMNCPHHCEIYRSKPRSYKELPVRLAEFGTVYRYEQSGELHGLTRVRGFTQDDAHMFVRPDQLLEEFEKRDRHRALYLQDAEVRQLYGTDFAARPQQQGEVHRFGRKLGEGRKRHHPGRQGERAQRRSSNCGEAAFYGPEAGFHGHAMPSAASGSWVRSRWITTCRSVST